MDQDFTKYMVKIALLFSAAAIPLMMGGKIASSVSGAIQSATKKLRENSLSRTRGIQMMDQRAKRKLDDRTAAFEKRADKNELQSRARKVKAYGGAADFAQRRIPGKAGQAIGDFFANKADSHKEMASQKWAKMKKDGEAAWGNKSGAEAQSFLDREMRKPAASRDRIGMAHAIGRLGQLDEFNNAEHVNGEHLAAAFGHGDPLGIGFEAAQDLMKKRPGTFNTEEQMRSIDQFMLGGADSKYGATRIPFPGTVDGISVPEFRGHLDAAKSNVDRLQHALDNGQSIGGRAVTASDVGQAQMEVDELRSNHQGIQAFTPVGRSSRAGTDRVSEYYPDQFGVGNNALPMESKQSMRISVEAASRWNTRHFSNAFDGGSGAIQNGTASVHPAIVQVLNNGGSVEQARQAGIAAANARNTDRAGNRVRRTDFTAYSEESQRNMIAAIGQQLGVEIKPENRR